MRTLEYMRPKEEKNARDNGHLRADRAAPRHFKKSKPNWNDRALYYLKPDVYQDLLNQVNARKTEDRNSLTVSLPKSGEHPKRRI